MITKSQVRQIITTNLNDIRMSSIQLFIDQFISRKVHGDGIEQYRIKDTLTDTYITSLNEFISKLDENHISYGYSMNSSIQSGEIITPMYILLNQYLVTLDENSDEDDVYVSRFGFSKTIALHATYMNDGDMSVPLKIYSVKLV